MTCRPLLIGGSAVFRRDRSHLQIGTNPGWVINDQPGLLGFLRKIDGVKDTGQLQRDCGHDIDVPSIIAELIGAGLAVDAAGWNGGPSREHQGNLARGLAPQTVGHRSEYHVEVIHDDAAAIMAATLRRLIAQAGLALSDGSDCDLIISCTAGEPDRTLFTAASSHGIDQLPIAFDGTVISCGPFVRPGRYPCLACYDFHRTDWDPAWPALIHQRAALPPGGVAVPVTLVQLACAYIVDDVISVAENRRPFTYATVRSYGPALHEHASRPVPFHPECACTRLLAEAS